MLKSLKCLNTELAQNAAIPHIGLHQAEEKHSETKFAYNCSNQQIHNNQMEKEPKYPLNLQLLNRNITL